MCLCEAYEGSFMTREKQFSLLNAMLADLLSLRRLLEEVTMARAKKLGVLLWFYSKAGEVSLPGSKWKLLVLVAEELSHLCNHGAGFAHFYGGTSHPGAQTKHTVLSCISLDKVMQCFG